MYVQFIKLKRGRQWGCQLITKKRKVKIKINDENKSEKETKNQSAKWPLKRQQQLKIKFVRA